MTTQELISELYHIDGQAEIVDGRIVRMPLHVPLVGCALMRIFLALYDHDPDEKFGYRLGAKVAYIIDLPHRKAFCPDLSIMPRNQPLGDEFPQGAPLFAVEARDPGQFDDVAEATRAAKRRDYFAAGTKVVWDVDVLSDPKHPVIRSYRADQPNDPQVFYVNDRATAEPALPGFSMPVANLLTS
jgi:Uma2 family endonuclease